jgi:hypothetical protein
LTTLLELDLSYYSSDSLQHMGLTRFLITLLEIALVKVAWIFGALC